ncbi:hypothetical protein F183_A06960 [Bryobacterales bacterium F-183]|nr:hypothetical protein F183_A06960 [Bryobacterales bacterium F-183]
MHTQFNRLSRLIASIALAAMYAFGQQTTTSLRGVITDSSGAGVPEAKVTLSETRTDSVRTVLSTAQGEYNFASVPPGNYSLKVEKPGFTVKVQQNLTLQVNTPATSDVTLEVGNLTETVSVEASVAQINTTDATIGNPFNQTQVRQLPLATRNVVELLSIQPGVSPGGQVLGARADQNNVTIDGVDANDQQNSSSDIAFVSVLPVPLDSVQEFRVTVGGQGADQGRSSGGQVSLITKSGTNQFHGSLYEFHRNTATAANTFFNNRSGVKREALVRNQFGGSLGGPIVKDRVFFFVNYEQRIDASGAAQSRIVPTESLKQGIVRFRQNDGTIGQLSPAEVRQLDPLGQGVSQAMISYLGQFPAGNDPSLGDAGINFTGLRFNAPFRRDNKAYVAKWDFKLDRQGNHSVSWRGTLADNAEDAALAQFPGFAPGSKILNNSRGFASQYTGVLRPNLINNLNVGLTRYGQEQSGFQGTLLTFAGNTGLAAPQATQRGNGRITPVWNITDDLNWIKGKHTVSTGVNFRFIGNDRFNFAQSFAAFGMSRGTMQGLGSDITTAITNYIRQRSGSSTLGLSAPNPTIEAMGTVLGMITNRSLTFQYDKNGQALPYGAALARNFRTNEYEFYVSDSWRVNQSLTLNFGVRYSNYQPPYETNGTQVNTTFPLDRWFGERVFLMGQGVPANAMPNARLTYGLSGPVNGKESWYGRDNNNWAPRFSFAYAPKPKGGLLSTLLGKSSVLRGGASMVYDRFGSDMIVNADSLGSVGLSTPSPFPASYNMATAPRFTGALPTIPTAPAASLPFTPTDVYAVAGTFFGINPNLKTPYSVILNMNYAREIKGGTTLEVGYAGRLARKTLLQGDIYTPLNLKDNKSGQDWIGMSKQMRDLYEGGLTPSQVQATPGRIGTNAYIENMWPTLANFYFPGNATANYFYHLFEENAGSDMDALHLLDRVRGYAAPSGQCASYAGCFTFFAPQGSAMPTWLNAGRSNYHAMTLSLRRPIRKGVGFDFNYTWSHSIDNGSAAESGSGQFGGTLQSVFFPNANRGSSDFDVRHNITANGVYDLPFGQGKAIGGNVNGFINQFIGGWQVSSIMRYRTGLPFSVGGTGVWNTNYWLGGRADPKGPITNNIVGINQRGNPSVFPNTNATSNFTDQYAGRVGARNIIRGDDFLNFDISMAKFFTLPWGPSDNKHKIQLRGEAFNAFNHVNFGSPSLSLGNPAVFGEITTLATGAGPRQFQFALRYEF